MPGQESFFRQLLKGDLPEPYGSKYVHFREHVMGDHLIWLVFSCNCWRFIEVTAKFMGRTISTRAAIPGQKAEWTMSYVFPEEQIQCNIRVLDPEWARRALKVFPMRVGYVHHYADHVFREEAKRLASQPATPKLVDGSALTW